MLPRWLLDAASGEADRYLRFQAVDLFLQKARGGDRGTESPIAFPFVIESAWRTLSSSSLACSSK